MKQYYSASAKDTIKAYKYNKKFCICCIHEDGTVITGQYITADKANEVFKAYKKRYPDLVRI